MLYSKNRGKLKQGSVMEVLGLRELELQRWDGSPTISHKGVWHASIWMAGACASSPVWSTCAGFKEYQTGCGPGMTGARERGSWRELESTFHRALSATEDSGFSLDEMEIHQRILIREVTFIPGFPLRSFWLLCWEYKWDKGKANSWASQSKRGGYEQRWQREVVRTDNANGS